MEYLHNKKKSDLAAIDCQRRERSWTLPAARFKKDRREDEEGGERNATLSVGNNYESGGEKGPIISSRNWSENAASLVHPLNGCHEEDMRTRA